MTGDEWPSTFAASLMPCSASMIVADVPDGYPLPAWEGDRGAPFYVAADYRSHYVAAAAAGAGSREGYDRGPVPHRDRVTVSTDGYSRAPEPVPYVEWAHRERLQAAAQIRRQIEAAAEREARLVACPVCGVRSNPAWLRPVQVAHNSVMVCTICQPGLDQRARAVDVVENGMTRGEAQDALIRRLTSTVDGIGGAAPVDSVDQTERAAAHA